MVGFQFLARDLLADRRLGLKVSFTPAVRALLDWRSLLHVSFTPIVALVRMAT